MMGVVSSNIFRTKDAPDYIPALVTTAAFGGMGICLTLGLGVWMIFDNRRRDRGEGRRVRAIDIPTERMREGPESKEFRWFY